MNAGINDTSMFSYEEPEKKGGKRRKKAGFGGNKGSRAADGTNGPFFQDIRAAVREVYDFALLSD